MLLALILVVAVTLLLCWLLLTMASLALPLFVGVAVGRTAFQAGAGLLGSFVIGVLTGGATLFAGQFLLATRRRAATRTGIVLLFAAPAAVAGYSAGHGLAAMAGASSFWQLSLGAVAGLCVALTAIAKLGAGIPDVQTVPLETPGLTAGKSSIQS
jgi:hypothetical protein